MHEMHFTFVHKVFECIVIDLCTQLVRITVISESAHLYVISHVLSVFSTFLAIFLSAGSYRTATWKKKTIIHKIYWQSAGAQIAFTFVVPRDWVLALCSRVQERMEECSK